MLSSKQIKVLIIDDDEDDYFIIQNYLHEIQEKKFVTEWCNNYDDAIQKIGSRAYDIYFVDFRLGNQSGLQVLQEATLLGCEEPIILLTGRGNKAIDIEAMKNGATDYLVKSELNSDKLERCMRYSLERNASLKSLKESEKKYKNLFESSKDAILITDVHFNFIEINQAAAILLHCTGKHPENKNLYDFLPVAEQREAIFSAIDCRRNITDFEVEIYNTDVERRYCTMSVSIEEKEDTELLHVIIHDITNLRNAEKVKLQSEKMAANERLIRILAHEVRNPLTNISLAADQLRLQLPDVPLAECVNIIKNNSKRINGLIGELLNFARPAELTFNTHTLQEILEESFSSVFDRLKLQNIKLVKQYSSQPCFISADKQKLTIAFSNLLINAIESMESNKGELSVRLEESISHYAVHIEDNGHGIPKEYLNRLSEPFFTMKRNGMGLGLASAYSIFLTHKASIEVKSEINKGTLFSIKFNGITSSN